METVFNNSNHINAFYMLCHNILEGGSLWVTASFPNLVLTQILKTVQFRKTKLV